MLRACSDHRMHVCRRWRVSMRWRRGGGHGPACTAAASRMAPAATSSCPASTWPTTLLRRRQPSGAPCVQPAALSGVIGSIVLSCCNESVDVLQSWRSGLIPFLLSFLLLYFEGWCEMRTAARGTRQWRMCASQKRCLRVRPAWSCEPVTQVSGERYDMSCHVRYSFGLYDISISWLTRGRGSHCALVTPATSVLSSSITA